MGKLGKSFYPSRPVPAIPDFFLIKAAGGVISLLHFPGHAETFSDVGSDLRWSRRQAMGETSSERFE